MENIEIHKEGELFCLNDIAAKLINSKNVKEFVTQILAQYPPVKK